MDIENAKKKLFECVSVKENTLIAKNLLTENIYNDYENIHFVCALNFLLHLMRHKKLKLIILLIHAKELFQLKLGKWKEFILFDTFSCMY